ncbi:hypothetical protein HDU76_008682 [Blyttiomyces sp. JEL0837]|nr:hypothetical protein HDU76_008682 [Blyttiomyces sp. JEL0837]
MLLTSSVPPSQPSPYRPTLLKRHGHPRHITPLHNDRIPKWRHKSLQQSYRTPSDFVGPRASWSYEMIRIGSPPLTVWVPVTPGTPVVLTLVSPLSSIKAQ